MITKWEYHPYISLGIFPTHHPYCGWLQNPAPVENGGLSNNLKGFNHPRVMRDFFQPQHQTGVN